jgi:GntR family transcriptional regulator, transcriptional repressor for pyruvate dehydrogenase complex
MPVTPIKSKKLYILIIDQLKALIKDGEFGPGDRLPTERDLAQRLGVSRGPVREALVALELVDIVEGRVGEGWFVKRTIDSAPDSTVRDHPPSDILEARLLVECAAIEQAACNLDDEDLNALRRTVDQFQEEIERGRYDGQADRAFHLTLAQASGNTVFTDLVACLWDLQNEQFFNRLDVVSGHQRERLHRYLAEHQAMFDALSVRDMSRARAAMRQHLEGVNRDLLDS